MLSLSKTALKSVHLPFVRSFAQVLNSTSNLSSILPHTKAARIPVREDHGLYGFFRRKKEEDLVGDAKYEVFDLPKSSEAITGRAWRASELRLKSFEDLHTLWYIVLRERNLLATQSEELRRLGVQSGLRNSPEKMHSCRKTMARIKVVINERRLAYEGALKLAEERQQRLETKEVLRHQDSVFATESKGHEPEVQETTEKQAPST